MTLQQWLTRKKLSNRKAARILGVSYEAIRRICRGELNCSLRTGLQIEARTERKVRVWELLSSKDRAELYGERGRP